MTKQKKQARTKRIKKLLAELEVLYPNPDTELVYTTPWQLLVAVILSAQCTDARVNIVTKNIFKKYTTLPHYAKASQEKFSNDIKSITFFNAKARNIIGAANMILEQYDSEVPMSLDALVALPGVGRKTAHVVMAHVAGKVEGIVVDTHVRRFAIRYDLTDHNDPIKIEQDLMEIMPRKNWLRGPNQIVLYGRYLAPARTYDISKDPLIKHYPKAGTRFRVGT